MAPPRTGGIRKKTKKDRKTLQPDRDGDLSMGAAPVPAQPQRPKSSLVELRVTGWTVEEDIPRIVQFLNRHASRRKGGPKQSGGPASLAPNLIKSSRFADGVLIIRVRQDDVPAFGKINNFQFTSTNGSQKLSISGPGIRASEKAADAESATLDKAAKDASTGKEEIMELLKGFLERRYDPSQKLLNLSNIASDEEISEIGMFTTTSRRAKFMPALMVAVDKALPSRAAKAEAIVSVSLSNNGLPDLSLVSDLARSLPDIKNLDLSGNELSDLSALGPFKSKLRNLGEIVLAGNPLQSQEGWQAKVTKFFPRLRLLDGVQVRTEEQVARLDRPKEVPMPSSSNLWIDPQGIAQAFVLDFIKLFDEDRNTLIQRWYDGESTFQLNVNARSRGGAGSSHDKTPWDSYLPQSRNIRIIHNKRARYSRKAKGPSQISEAFGRIPPTRHPLLESDAYNLSCIPQQNCPDPTGQSAVGVTGFLITLQSQYEEHRTAKGANQIVRRAFERTIVLAPGGPSGWRIISDLMSLHAGGGIPAWIPQNTTPAETPAPAAVPTGGAPAPPVLPLGLTPEQQAIVMQVQADTRLKADVAVDLLTHANWDIAAAATLFQERLHLIPPESFDGPAPGAANAGNL